MSLMIDTSPELEDKLREDAERHGVDAASYALQLLEQRYLRVHTPVSVPDMPKVGTRWRSASGLDADAIEDRRPGGAAASGRSHRRSSRRQERQQRRKSLTTQVASIAIVLALVAGLVYAFIASRPPRHVAAHPPVSSRPSAPVTEKKPDAAPPPTDAAKPQGDVAKPQGDVAKPQVGHR